MSSGTKTLLISIVIVGFIPYLIWRTWRQSELDIITWKFYSKDIRTPGQFISFMDVCYPKIPPSSIKALINEVDTIYYLEKSDSVVFLFYARTTKKINPTKINNPGTWLHQKLDNIYRISIIYSEPYNKDFLYQSSEPVSNEEIKSIDCSNNIYVSRDGTFWNYQFQSDKNYCGKTKIIHTSDGLFLCISFPLVR